MPHDDAQRAVDHATHEVLGAVRPKLTIVEYASYLSHLERSLAGVVGSASAHVAMKAVGAIERKDKRELEREFARVLAELKLNPRELKQRVDFEKEKSALLEEQFHRLEQKNGELESRVLDRTRELRAILDNVLFGFLVVGCDGRVRDGYGLSPVVKVVHAVEDQPAIEHHDIEAISQAFRSFLEANSAVLGISFDAERHRSWTLSDRDLAVLEHLLPQLSPDYRKAIEHWLAAVARVPFRNILGPVHTSMTNLAARLDRLIDFTDDGLDLRVDRDRFRPLAHSLVHLLRNAINHGIEPPHQRGDKPPRGRIHLELREAHAGHAIRVSDDGRGIDTTRVVQVAIERGVITRAEAEALSEDDKLMLIFADRVSTAAEVTDISGRGIGMSAVLAEVHKVGGKILIETQLGKGTSIEIVIPRFDLGTDREAA
jgi:chemotaxis protein histidine kinase CheA